MKPECCEFVPPKVLLDARKLAIEEILKAVPSEVQGGDENELFLVRTLVREVAGAGFDAGVKFMADTQTKEKEPR